MNRGVAVAIASVWMAGAGPAWSFERRAPDEDGPTAWLGASSTVISYYNLCTGWVWHPGNHAGQRLGVVVDTGCGPGATLGTTWHFYYSGYGCGWGFDGTTISILAVDANDCPVDPALDSQPICPGPDLDGWMVALWDTQVPSRFAVVLDLGSRWISSYPRLRTDHPAAGPTGPPACGTCYPTTRVNHSFLFADGDQVFCPPEVYYTDSACNAELTWYCSLLCPVSREPTSWGRVKALFR